MSLIRHPLFLRAYRLLPHRLLNGAMRRIGQIERPRGAVATVIRLWARHEKIDLDEFEQRQFVSLEDFFLRRLREGARPIGEGFVSPVDGRVVGAGRIAANTVIDLKGHPLSLGRVVNGLRHDLSLAPFEGGVFIAIFLSPRGYHYIHMPESGEIRDCRWLPGRFFPQNEQALAQIPGIYERNERAVLRCHGDGIGEFLLILVGASLVGGIHLAGYARSDWARAHKVPLDRRLARGDEIGHFTFGSTVVLLLPPGAAPSFPTVGDDLLMGQSLFG
ncbi:MAG: phosphatidylserine decarboxylase [Myxococcales bacterium]|nr:phosphatidylserine decarboxylase [Myxococcales bacterium]